MTTSGSRREGPQLKKSYKPKKVFDVSAGPLLLFKGTTAATNSLTGSAREDEEESWRSDTRVSCDKLTRQVDGFCDMVTGSLFPHQS